MKSYFIKFWCHVFVRVSGFMFSVALGRSSPGVECIFLPWTHARPYPIVKDMGAWCSLVQQVGYDINRISVSSTCI